jgi:hypothetical protein
MTLANMRELGVQHLVASCLNDVCRHSALIDVSSYPGETGVPWFRSRVKCGKCGGRNVDVRPIWKEQPSGEPDRERVPLNPTPRINPSELRNERRGFFV